MKSKIIQNIFILTVILLFLCSCGKEDLGNTYIEGQDYQYMFISEQQQDNLTQARGENGTFFATQNYLFYLEDGSDEAVPLCNKPDCLHNKETDTIKKKECNAYINDVFWAPINIQSIAYYDGYLYCVDNFENELYGVQKLYRYSVDGSKKEMLYEWEESRINYWIIHRGVLYYVEQNFPKDSDDIEVQTLKKMDLKNKWNKKSATIYAETEHPEIKLGTIASLSAYGNYMYFSVSGTQIEEDGNHSAYLPYFVYDINNEELDMLHCPEEDENIVIGQITFLQDKLIIKLSDLSESDAVSKAYIAELDGSNPRVAIEEILDRGTLYSDGEYLYASNGRAVFGGLAELPVEVLVYDKEFQLIDTYTMPFLFWGQAGYKDCLYIPAKKDEEGNMKIIRFDKKHIGTLNGSEIPYDLILDM